MFPIYAIFSPLSFCERISRVMKESQFIRKPVSNRTPFLLIDKLPLMPVFAPLSKVGSRISTANWSCCRCRSSLLEWNRTSNFIARARHSHSNLCKIVPLGFLSRSSVESFSISLRDIASLGEPWNSQISKTRARLSILSQRRGAFMEVSFLV